MYSQVINAIDDFLLRSRDGWGGNDLDGELGDLGSSSGFDPKEGTVLYKLLQIYGCFPFLKVREKKSQNQIIFKLLFKYKDQFPNKKLIIYAIYGFTIMSIFMEYIGQNFWKLIVSQITWCL